MLPFALDSAEKELNLSAYVWADQPHRLQRLREGIDAFHVTNQQATPVQLFSVTLSDQLPGFLETTVAEKLRNQNHDEPVILYNTYMTNYLPDKGAALHAIIDHWARQQPRSVLWLQWEPTYGRLTAPEFRRIAYSAEMWHKNQNTAWHLGWVHPHGIHFQVDPAWTAFRQALAATVL